ncbi:MAG: methylmalonyl-CoA epimerase [Acidobacteriia bacterium]|nr:methylmalonyl-CoA epimerase [Terriglobia bacterium]
MSLRLDHVGIAVRSLEDRLRFWSGALGLEVEGIETIESEGVRVAFLRAGEARLELIEPLREDSPIGRHLDRRGEGIHHLTLEADDLDAAVKGAVRGGAEVLGGGARPGAGGREVAFLHPRSCGGVLVEVASASRPAEPARLGPGQPVLLYLRDPQEKLWGVLRGLDTTGITIEGVDLASFDDWVVQVERGSSTAVGPSLLFFPMQRVERVLLDRPSGDLPSLADRFRKRTGRSVRDVLG